MDNKGLEIAQNIRCIETLKGEILKEIGNLYLLMANNCDSSELSLCISKICALNYFLANRLGISYTRLELDIESLIKNNEFENVAKYEDIRSLMQHISIKNKFK